LHSEKQIITLPELSLVVLIGPSGAGKSTFARKHFKSSEVLSSDFCRGLVSDDENDQTATNEAFDVLHYIAGKRLKAGRLTVIDATNVKIEDRNPLVALARQYHCIPVALVFNLHEKVCRERNRERPDRDFREHVIRQQCSQMRRALRGLKREGFSHVFFFDSPEAVDVATIERTPLWNNLKHEHGPFDIIGDVHGCHDELVALLTQLGYTAQAGGAWAHPAGRKLVFVGDLVDRGPLIPETVRLVMESVKAGSALCVPGNHDVKFMRSVWGKQVQITHGLAESIEQFDRYEEHYRAFNRVAAEFIDDLVSHYVLDDGNLVVAHAGLKEEMQGRGSGKVRDFCLYGETTGETDEFGLPVRYPWAQDYRGRAMVVYGHTPVPEAEWLNRTINIDTGCVFGGQLTALRYPELEIVSVPAERVYCTPSKPFLSEPTEPTALSAQQQHDDVLDLADVTGKRFINTRLQSNITVREGNAMAALEVMSRFAVNPKWLIYLPPTMSPSATSDEPGLLEHPREAFDYFLHEGTPKVVCQQKHMGSRAVVIICRDEEAAQRRFGVTDEGIGICYTRTGRRFFNDAALELAFLDRIRDALNKVDFWTEFETEWACLDCELMPWSAKAQELLRSQYAAVGAAGHAALTEATAALTATAGRIPEATALLGRYNDKARMLGDFVAAYREYCWPVHSLTDLKLAPFHLLATEGHVHVNRDHIWHMETLARVCATDSSLLLITPYQIVDLTDPSSVESTIAWWTKLTHEGGEGMVVKPFDFIRKGRRGLIQPALKCRGREYLRIIYGPDYTTQENLDRLRQRGLSLKRSLALREFALGIESLERFVRYEPLRRVHECVFAVLALESEPIDPRL
jgi:protein phosphatase